MYYIMKIKSYICRIIKHYIYLKDNKLYNSGSYMIN